MENGIYPCPFLILKVKKLNMKFLVSLVLVLLTGFAASLYATETPWWFFAIGCFLVGWLVPQHAFVSWLAGFLGIFLLWALLAWRMDTANESIMSTKMASILPLGGSSVYLMLLSAGIGGLVGGMASLAGAFLRKSPSK
jgi:hypothetical protein